MQDQGKSPVSRRFFLAGGLAAAAVSWRPGGASAADAHAPPAKTVSATEAMRRLRAGNARWARGAPARRNLAVRRAGLVAGQHPFAVVLGCSDSRVTPELVFDQGPGDLFVVRVAGNFVEPDGLATIEYAVEFLGSALVFVLGHSSCGAVDAAVTVAREGTALPGALPTLVARVTPAVEAARRAGTPPADLVARSVSENVRLAVEELRTEPLVLARRVRAGALTVVGGVYDLKTGRVAMVA